MPLLIAAGTAYRADAILFDKDGTLLDFMYTWGNWSECLLASFSAFLKERGLPPIGADMSALWGTRSGPDGEVSGYDRNGPLAMGTIDELLSILAWHGYRSGLSWAEAKTAAQQGRQLADERLRLDRRVRPLPGAVSFLERCRSAGFKLAVVTADETAEAERHLEWLGVRPLFGACVGTDLVRRGKPFPDMAELACRRLSVDPARAVVIGDTNGDMRMARAAGAAAAVGIAADAAAAHLADADAVVASYGELSACRSRTTDERR